jgi:hypothetical protein
LFTHFCQGSIGGSISSSPPPPPPPGQLDPVGCELMQDELATAWYALQPMNWHVRGW